MAKASIAQYGYTLLAVGLCSCTPKLPPIALSMPGHDHPVEQTVADRVRTGMSSDEVIQLAGKAGAAGGVAPAPPAFGADAYSVFWDPGATPDWANSTWIYLIIRSGDPARDGRDHRYLFVEMKAGVVVRAYQGRVATWSA